MATIRLFNAGEKLIREIKFNPKKGLSFSERGAALQRRLNLALLTFDQTVMAMIDNERYEIVDGKSRFMGFLG